MQALNMKYARYRFSHLSAPAILAILAIFLFSSMPSFGQARVIEVLADKDSHFKMAGMSHPEITVKAGEPLLLRINARKGKTMNRDGTVHGFTLLRAKDHHKVAGWDLELKPGTQEFSLTAPAEPGEYEVLCTVICSEEHEGMRMKFVVLP
jgi:heme/copper-type cytochrome/quinol oxidase subunit 2